jgi:hypothetical protein
MLDAALVLLHDIDGNCRGDVDSLKQQVVELI